MDNLLESPALDGGLCESVCPSESVVCGHHGQSFSLFCLDDLSPVCSECEESDTHEGHRIYRIQDALHDCKEEIETSVNVLKQKIWTCDLIKQTCQSAIEHNQSEALQMDTQMKEEFEKLHQFLKEEEERRITALREEEQQKSQTMKEQSLKIDQIIECISNTIRAIEEGMKMDDVDFQEGYEETVRRICQCKQKPEERFGSLINVSEHVANLRFKVWKKMLRIVTYTPVTLDPNTASSSLCISPALNQVLHLEECQPFLPAVPERFDPYACTLGSEVMSSGQHSWVVEVGDSSNWTLGVAKVSIKCTEMFEACPEEGLWVISLRDDEYWAMTSPCQRVSCDGHRPKRIRVCLDCDDGRLEFTDPDHEAHLFTFTHSFSDVLVPYIETICKGKPLEILPKMVSVEVEKHTVPDDDNRIISESSHDFKLIPCK
ncbi:E3 ubiquitin-protein ligase TRIM35-like [Myxocyprinus asiaticus]|uniref:E3 ubiquitin-protein ligase TRIM35-like n=1 Tax=Myxocyprinus asiaticus TaxID=70543 RepID=UPI002223C1F1|nr:E3 ubiquitin-protein ligase TRIM35-like [Myxocyprinus asiaticus]